MINNSCCTCFVCLEIWFSLLFSKVVCLVCTVKLFSKFFSRLYTQSIFYFFKFSGEIPIKPLTVPTWRTTVKVTHTPTKSKRLFFNIEIFAASTRLALLEGSTKRTVVLILFH